MMPSTIKPVFRIGAAEYHHANCLEWLRSQPPETVHAVVTDPPYGLVEYSQTQKDKLRDGTGGVWRTPPSFGGSVRSPLPRFTTLTVTDLEWLETFFREWAEALVPVLVPGANVIVASNPLVSHLVAGAICAGGLERRGEIVRLLMTLRGGDRPKNAHVEFPNVSVMPRSKWEPWLMFRKPLDGTVAQNLRRWGTGGFRRISDDLPFADVIQSGPTRPAERVLAPHPSLKPQEFLRPLVRGALPLGTGRVLDTFAGSGATLAAAEHVGYTSVGVDSDLGYVELAEAAIPKLCDLTI